MSNQNNSTTSTSANIEVITMNLSNAQQKAVRHLARTDKKRSASELANDLFNQVIKGRLNAKLDKVTEEETTRWDMVAAMVGVDKMPKAKAEYVAEQKAELQAIINDLK